MRHRSLAASTRLSIDVSGGRVESQYLVGSASPSGHSTISHSSARGSGGAIAGDRDDARALPEPVRDDLGAASPQKLDHATAFEIAYDRAIGLPAAESPVVDSDHPRRGRRIERDGADEAQQRVPAHRHGEAMCQTRAGLAARHARDLELNVAQPCRAAQTHGHDPGQTFSEDLAGATRRCATKASNPNVKDDAAALPGKIVKTAPVEAMRPVRGAPAIRAGRRRTTDPGKDRDLIGLRVDLIDDETSGNKRGEAREHAPVVNPQAASAHVTLRLANLHQKCG